MSKNGIAKVEKGDFSRKNSGNHTTYVGEFRRLINAVCGIEDVAKMHLSVIKQGGKMNRLIVEKDKDSIENSQTLSIKVVGNNWNQVFVFTLKQCKYTTEKFISDLQRIARKHKYDFVSYR